jgi:predicted acyltransferase
MRKRISINKLPRTAFDSDDERAKVAILLDRYNHPPGSEQEPSANEPDSSGDAASNDESNDDTDSAASGNDSADSEADSDDSSDADDEDEEASDVLMTPEIDEEFALIADARIARSPARYYFWLPIQRAAALWFDSHSRYYPFGGQISPVRDLDADESQQYWLPAFLAVLWLYTVLAVGGVVALWRDPNRSSSLRWLILVGLMTLPRIVFLSTIENPEPRYVVELFFYAWILGGIFLGGLKQGEKTNVPPAPYTIPSRVWSLDVFRGMTIAAMILVNDPGSWSAIYPPLEHAEWHGVTPTDCIFPFFLFIVGVSITFALARFDGGRDVGAKVLRKVGRRAVLLFVIGLALEIFPFYNVWTGEWFQPETVRVMGVLQRIAICYFVTALVSLHTSWRKQAVIAGALLLGYWILMTTVHVPNCIVTSVDDRACNLAAYIDRLILTENHIWNQSKVFDPEGILSTLPAIATTMIGALAGTWLQKRAKDFEKFVGLAFGGIALVALGYLWSFVFPFNKSLWTSSFAVFTAGLASCVFALCYWTIDLKGYRRWSRPFVVFGANAIALYVGSSMMSAIFNVWTISTPTDESISLQEMIYQYFFAGLAAPQNASLLFALWFVGMWWLTMWLLYRRRVFIKI